MTQIQFTLLSASLSQEIKPFIGVAFGLNVLFLIYFIFHNKSKPIHHDLIPPLMCSTAFSVICLGVDMWNVTYDKWSSLIVVAVIAICGGLFCHRYISRRDAREAAETNRTGDHKAIETINAESKDQNGTSSNP